MQLEQKILVKTKKKETCENNYLIELMNSIENDKYSCILKLLKID